MSVLCHKLPFDRRAKNPARANHGWVFAVGLSNEVSCAAYFGRTLPLGMLSAKALGPYRLEDECQCLKRRTKSAMGYLVRCGASRAGAVSMSPTCREVPTPPALSNGCFGGF